MPQAADYQGIRFSYAEMKRHMENMGALATDFLAPQSQGVVEQCVRDLENIRCAKSNRNQTWQISRTLPVRTRDSDGKYRDSTKEGGTAVYGLLSFTWEILNPDRSQRNQRFFHLVGIASTSVIVKSVGSDEIVARWQFEAGDAMSPGCHFHSAVNQYEKAGLFPEWLKVPRFPGLLFCPMDGLEFLLGELFQREWHQALSKSSHQRDEWAKSQKKRLESVLKWKLEQVTNCDTTPWMSLKKARPPLGILTSQ